LGWVMVCYGENEPYIFFSYSHKDESAAMEIVRRLQDRGFRVWYDSGVEPGEDWSDEIAGHLDACEVFLLFVTDHSMDSRYCKDELLYAKNTGKTIVPVVYNNVELIPSMEMHLSSLQRFDYRESHADGDTDRLCALAALAPCREGAAITMPEKIRALPKKKRRRLWLGAAAACLIALLAILAAEGGYMLGHSAVQSAPTATVDPEARATAEPVPNGLQYEITGDEITIVYYSGNAKNIVIPSQISNLPVTTISDSAFFDCSKLETVTIQEGITYLGPNAFYGCTSLRDVTLPASLTTVEGNPFTACSCPDLTITVSEGNPALEVTDGMLFDQSEHRLIAYPCGRADESCAVPDGTEIIGASAFNSAASLKSISLPDSVREIGSDAFAYCASLSEMTLPSSLNSLDRSAFCFCTSLTSVTIPDSLTTLTGNPFVGCSDPDLSFNLNSSHPTMTFEDGLLVNRETKTVICYPCGRADESCAVPDGIEVIGNEAFSRSQLKEIVLPDSVKTIESWAFSDSPSLTSVTLSPSITAIDVGVFSGCAALETLALPSGIETIEWGAFMDCASLKEVWIPNTVSSIDSGAFNGCPGITLVVEKSNSYVVNYAKETGLKCVSD